MPKYKNIRSAYDDSRLRVTVGGGDSMVRQAFKDEADINNIVARYEVSGQLPLTEQQARFGDVSDVRDYKASLDFVREATEDLEAMPQDARVRFFEDPRQFMSDLENAKNRDDLVQLGIFDAPESPEPDVAPVVEAEVPPPEPPVVPPVA